MQQFAKIAMLIAISSMLASCGGSGSKQALPVSSVDTVRRAAAVQNLAEANNWKPVYATLQPQGVNFDTLDAQPASAAIPFFKGTVTSPLDRQTFTFRIAGADPHTSRTTTHISYVPIVARIHFPDGTVLDPALPGCGDALSVSNRFFKGPNFVPTSLTSNGVNVGTTQITDAFQRAEFWTLVKGTNYHTVLTAAAPPKVVDVAAPAGSTTVAGVCAGSHHRIGLIDFAAYTAIVQKLSTQHATTAQVPIVLSYNVFQTQMGQCCIIGFHGAFARTGGTQVFAVGSYNDTGIFNAPVEDIHAWTHEIGELLNDPFGNNVTPAWGHVGQVATCQNNLEVGDPLTGTPFTVKLNSFTYHPQELAFFSWFFRTPSTGTGGEFSFEGSFESAQGACA